MLDEACGARLVDPAGEVKRDDVAGARKSREVKDRDAREPVGAEENLARLAGDLGVVTQETGRRMRATTVERVEGDAIRRLAGERAEHGLEGGARQT